MKKAIGLTMALIPVLFLAGMFTWIMATQHGWIDAMIFWIIPLIFAAMIVGGLKLAGEL